MQKEILLNILEQNKTTCSFAFGKITSENSDFRLSEQTSSAGFIYRHIGETINLFGTFFGVSTEIKNTTMGENDDGRDYDLGESKEFIEKGFEMLQNLIENSTDSDWLKIIETPFFGDVPRIRLFAHVLFHTSSHAGQISMILAKGKKF